MQLLHSIRFVNLYFMKKFGINNSMNFDKNKKLNRMFLEIKLG